MSSAKRNVRMYPFVLAFIDVLVS